MNHILIEMNEGGAFRNVALIFLHKISFRNVAYIVFYKFLFMNIIFKPLKKMAHIISLKKKLLKIFKM